jgi:hypothetical protein
LGWVDPGSEVLVELLKSVLQVFLGGIGGTESSREPLESSTGWMKTDRVRMDIADIIFIFIFLSKFRFEYG